MLKQIVIYLIASILVILFARFAYEILSYIHAAFLYAGQLITPFFNLLDLGLLSRKICILIVVPLAFTGIPALIYKAVNGKQMPWFMESTWILWLILVLSHILIR